MDALIQNFQENMTAYIAGTAIVLPLLYVFRSWAGPIIFHAIETVVYLGAFHILTGGLIRFFQYFKSSTEMNALGPGERTPVWTTPMNLDLWRKELYTPEWLAYVELGGVVVILFLIMKLRPLGHKRRNQYAGKSGKVDKNKPRNVFDEEFGPLR